MKYKRAFPFAAFAALACLVSCSPPWQKGALPHKEPYKSTEDNVTLTFQRLEGEERAHAVIRFANHSNHDVIWYGYDNGGGPTYSL